MSDYEPGTVAVATVQGQANVRVVRVPRRDEFLWMRIEGRYSWATDEEVTDVRPLVVLDPTCLGDVPFIVRQLRAAGFTIIAGHIEAQTRPPKPDEPTGLGAVVKDREGHRWVLCPDGSALSWWRSIASRPLDYADLDVVEVLSPGVTP